MNKVLLQFLKLHFLVALFVSFYVPAEIYDVKEFINLNGSICNKPNKHLTILDSGFLEYIGADNKKIFECGRSVEMGNDPCRNDPELICRNKYKNHILQRSDSLIINANNFLAGSEKFKNRKKLQKAIKNQTEINQSWKNSQDILTLIDSLEREIIYTFSLLPSQIIKSINQELRQQHDNKKQKILEERRLAKEANLKKQKQKQAQQEMVALKNQESDEQIKIILFILGVASIVILVGVLSSKWILFDSEKDFFMTLGLLISVATLVFMLEDNSNSQNVSFSGDLFYWSLTLISSALSIWFLIATFMTSIKGNGFFVGLFIYLFKISFCLIMVLFIIGKVGDILNNKDKRTSANRAPVLAILALLAIFWKPIKSLLINGDKVRAKREASSLKAKNKPTNSKKEINDLFDDL